MLALVVVHRFIYALPLWIALGTGFMAIGGFIWMLVWGAKNVDSNFFINVKSKGDGSKNEVALSFDDGPAAAFTPQILDILRQHKVSAAFFCIGQRIAEHEDIVERIHAEGHVIGNHSYSHNFWFDMKSARGMRKDLQMANEEIMQHAGVQPRLFRPPYGVTNPNLAKAIETGNYIPVGWSIRSLDTVIKDEQKLMERVTANIRPGDIFLFHDHCEATVKILPALIEHIRGKGFTIQRVDKLLKVPAYA